MSDSQSAPHRRSGKAVFELQCCHSHERATSLDTHLFSLFSFPFFVMSIRIPSHKHGRSRAAAFLLTSHQSCVFSSLFVVQLSVIDYFLSPNIKKQHPTHACIAHTADAVTFLFFFTARNFHEHSHEDDTIIFLSLSLIVFSRFFFFSFRFCISV